MAREETLTRSENTKELSLREKFSLAKRVAGTGLTGTTLLLADLVREYLPSWSDFLPSPGWMAVLVVTAFLYDGHRGLKWAARKDLERRQPEKADLDE